MEGIPRPLNRLPSRFLVSLTLLSGVASVTAQSLVPDFSLQDINTNSDRRKATGLYVSPRDYLHQVTAWYFGWEG